MSAAFMAEDVRAARVALGLSQRGLAQQLGIDPSIVALWEKGRRPVSAPRQQQLAQLAAAAGVTPLPHQAAKVCARCGRLRRLVHFARSSKHAKTTRDVCRRCVHSESSTRLWRDPEYRRRVAAAGKDRPDAWHPDELEFVRTHIGTASLEWISEQLRAISGVRRTRHAIRFRAYALGLSTWRNGLTTIELARAFGVSTNMVAGWRRLGLLVGRALGPMWVFSDAEVRQFVQLYPWQYDPRRMRPGSWRSLAEVTWRRNPWLDVYDLARLCDASATWVRKLAQRGELPVQRRVGSHGGHFMFPPDAVEVARAIRDAWSPRGAARARAAARARYARPQVQAA